MRTGIKREIDILQIDNDFADLVEENDTSYQYKITYYINPIKAYQNNSNLVEILISDSPLIKQKINVFSSRNPNEILTNILIKSSNQRDVGQAKEAKILFKQLSDFTKKIPNDKTTQIQRSTSKNFIIKNAKNFKLLSVNELNTKNIINPVLESNYVENIFPGITKETLDSISIKKSYFDLLEKKVDPAIVAGQKLSNLISANRIYSGLGVKKTKENYELRKVNTLEKAKVLNFFINRTNPTNQSDLTSNNFVNVHFEESQFLIKVDEYLIIPKESIKNNDFFISFNVRNKIGVNVQTLYSPVNHSKFVSQRDIPYVPPEIQGSSIVLGKNIICVKQLDPKATGIYIYRKEVRNITGVFDAKYNFVAKIDTVFGDDFVQIEDYINNFNPIIYRAIPFNENGSLSGEFSSIVTNPVSTTNKRNLRKPNFISIQGLVNSDSIDLKIDSIPFEVITFFIYRKDLTIFEKTGILIQTVYISEPEQINNITITDTGLKKNHIYEYYVDFLYKDGLKATASNNLVIKYHPITSNIVETTLSIPEIINNDLGVDIKFTITSNLIPTENENIKSVLQRQGLYEYYQSIIGDEKTKLQKIIAYNIKRTNISTGEIEDFGTITDVNFSDTQFGKLKNVKPLEEGLEYSYTVTTLFRSPETMLETLTETVDVSTTLSYSYSPFTWKHPQTLEYGTLISSTSLSRNHAYAGFSFGTVGNVVTTNVSLLENLPTILEANATKTNKNTILIQWRIHGNANKFDHFIVILEILGMRTVAGKVHNITDSNYFNFIDVLDNNEKGELKYFIKPVFYNYAQGAEFATNEVIV